MVDRRSARAALESAVARRSETREADESARIELEAAIVAGHRAGLTQVELVEISGYHRNTISKMTAGVPRD